MVLVDCGVTSNFLSWEVARKLQLKVEPTPKYSVEVGHGQREFSQGICKDVMLMMQGTEVQQHFFLLNLGGTDVVLGMDWLASLGKIVADFEKLTLEWKERVRNCIQGDPTLYRAQSSWKANLKVLKNEGEGYFVDPIRAAEE